jgi:hypothetical protein
MVSQSSPSPSPGYGTAKKRKKKEKRKKKKGRREIPRRPAFLNSGRGCIAATAAVSSIIRRTRGCRYFVGRLPASWPTREDDFEGAAREGGGGGGDGAFSTGRRRLSSRSSVGLVTRGQQCRNVDVRFLQQLLYAVAALQLLGRVRGDCTKDQALNHQRKSTPFPPPFFRIEIIFYLFPFVFPNNNLFPAYCYIEKTNTQL